MADIMIPAWLDGKVQPVEKLCAHKRGLRHKAVSVFVLWGENILLQRRAMGKYHTPGLWANTCCTHPRWDEPDAICAERRLEEELGIRDIALTHRGRVEYRADVGAGLIEHEVVEIFTAETSGALAVVANPEEVMAVRWVAMADLRAELDQTPEIFTPWLRIYMAEHSALIFGGLV